MAPSRLTGNRRAIRAALVASAVLATLGSGLAARPAGATVPAAAAATDGAPTVTRSCPR